MINDDKDKVSKQHPDYIGLQDKRGAFFAVKGGTDAIRKEGVKFLPKYPAESDTDYQERLKQATIDGLVQGGVESLTGAVMDGPIDVSKVNSAITPLLDNIDNRGNTFDVFARDVFDASFDGCSIVVADMPMLDEQGKQTQAVYGAEADKMLDLRPYLVLYKAQDVINWRFRINPVTKQLELTLLVVRVISEEPDGEFGTKNVTRYCVWRMGTAVTWEHWIQPEKDSDPVLEKSGTIATATRIPARIIGKLNADPKLLVESRLEIKAYQKESSVDTIEYLSVPLMCFIGRTDGVGEAMPYGPSSFVDVPIGGDAKFVQIDAAGLDKLKGTIDDIKAEIKARLNYTASAPMPEKTATQSVIEDKDKQARLIVWAEELEDGLAGSLDDMCMLIKAKENNLIELMTAWKKAEIAAAEQKEVDAELHKATVAKMTAGGGNAGS